MTPQEEALDVMKRLRIVLATSKVDGIRVLEPISMAIEALQDQTTVRKMAEFISHMDIDEQICKKMPTVEAKECNDCRYRSYRGTDIDSCRECVVFYEDDCAYGDCVNCIIEFFRREKND